MKKKTVRRVLSYVMRQKAMLLFAIVCAAVYVAGTLAVPVLVGRFIDTLGQGITQKAFELLAGVALSALLAAGAQWLLSDLNNRIANAVVRQIRTQAIEKIHRLPFSYLDRTPAGDVVSKIMNDTDVFSDGLLMGFTQLFTGILTIAGTVGFMFSMNLRASLAVVVLTPLTILVSRFVAKGTYRLFLKQASLRAELSAFTEETVVGRNTVRAFGREKQLCSAFSEKNEELRKVSGKAIFLSSLTNPTTRFLNALIYAVVTLIGALMCVAGGGMTVGMLSSFLAYASQYAKPFNEISGVVAEIQNALACAARLFDFLDEPEETPDPEEPLTMHCTGKVGAQKVCFSYDPCKKLIEDFDLDVSPGQRVAIVGPTGCGKTTLINLLMRFYDPLSGRMTVEDNDIRRYTRKDLRAQYGMVLQENWIGKMSVLDNIRRGKPEATREEAIAAAKEAHAHEFIVRLPNGYDTVLEENGEGLSLGQKQLICIAAVMLVQPPMLILDEATASIDTRTERMIQDAFDTLMRGRTCFIVAHRLSTIRNTDRILVMNKGQIVESGTHTELLAKKGFYSELYNAQFA